MTTSLALYLPYDKTGQAASNTVTFEFHQTAFGAPGLIKPDYGAFYKTSPTQPFELYVQGSGQLLTLLTLGTDYQLAEFDPDESARSGYDVYKAVLVTNTALSGIYAISYQAVGGSSNPNVSATYQQAQNPMSASGPTDFADIEDKPATYPPAAHQHDVRDVFGAEYLVTFLNNLTTTIQAKFFQYPTGVKAKDAEIAVKINNFTASLAAYAAQVLTNINTHVGNTGLPHAYTAAQVGLGNVANGGFTVIASLPVYASPKTVGDAIINKPAASPSGHQARTDNPHGTTSAQIPGLTNVVNYGVVTAYATGNYTAIFDVNSTPMYVTPYVVNNGVTEAQAAQLQAHLTNGLAPITDATTGLLAQATAANTTANTALTNATTALTNTGTALTNATTKIDQAKAANRHFTMVLYNALYAETIKQLLATDYAAFATNSSVSVDGYYVVPPLLDNLYLWLDVNHVANTYQNDSNGTTRLMTLVDRSPNAREFASNNLASAPIFRQSSDITEGAVGISVGKVAVFTNGTHMDQISGSAVAFSPGMTIFLVVRPLTSDTPFTVLADSTNTPTTALVVQPSPGVALQMKTNTTWQPYLAADATLDASTTTLLVAGVSPEGEAYNWLAPVKTLPSAHPQGVVTQPGNVWPTDFTQSVPLTRIGNALSGTLCGAEFVTCIAYNRQLSFAEAEAVIAYIQLSKSHYQAFVVDTSAQNAF